MKREVWLAANRRAILFGMIAPALILLAGVSCLASAAGGPLGRVATVMGAVLVLVGLLVFISLGIMFRMPRLAYQNGYLLVYLGTAHPYRVPIEQVEVFFLGQAPSGMPKTMWEPGNEPSESSTVVVRIAESAAEWKQREVRSIFGQWCDGYIIVRGTWSEPITGDVVMRLNRRLVECHREVRQQKEQTS